MRSAERRGELFRVERVAGRPQGHDAPGRARHRDARGVGVVVGLEGHDLVAGLAQREQRGGDRLGGAGGDEDLAVRVELDAVEAALVGGDRGAQLGDAGSGRVLVDARAHRLHGRLEDLGRAVRVREALAEVDRPGPRRQRGHLGEDRRAEAGEAGSARAGPRLGAVLGDPAVAQAHTSWPRNALPRRPRSPARPARRDEVAVDERADFQLEVSSSNMPGPAISPRALAAATSRSGQWRRRRRPGRPRRPVAVPELQQPPAVGVSVQPPDSTARAGGRRAPRGRSAGRPRTSGRARAPRGRPRRRACCRAPRPCGSAAASCRRA